MLVSPVTSPTRIPGPLHYNGCRRDIPISVPFQEFLPECPDLCEQPRDEVLALTRTVSLLDGFSLQDVVPRTEPEFASLTGPQKRGACAPAHGDAWVSPVTAV